MWSPKCLPVSRAVLSASDLGKGAACNERFVADDQRSVRMYAAGVYATA